MRVAIVLRGFINLLHTLFGIFGINELQRGVVEAHDMHALRAVMYERVAKVVQDAVGLSHGCEPVGEPDCGQPGIARPVDLLEPGWLHRPNISEDEPLEGL